MSALTDVTSRTDLLNRLKRAEGQLRGIQRMLEENQDCMDIATQMAAVRKALDSTHVQMTMCFMQQSLRADLPQTDTQDKQLGAVMDSVQALLSRLR